MTTIPFQELVDFVQSQPDDREIDMGESNSNEAKCGCVLVHFGLFKNLPEVRAGFNHLTPGTCIEYNRCRTFITDCWYRRITTYAQAKEILNTLQ